MSHKKRTLLLVIAEKLLEFLCFLTLQAGQVWRELSRSHTLSNTRPLLSHRTSLCSRKSVFCWHFLQERSEMTKLQTRTLPKKINQSGHGIHHHFDFSTKFCAQYSFMNGAMKCQKCWINRGKSAHQALLWSHHGRNHMDTILCTSKLFFTRNRVSSLKRISPVVRPGRGSKQF